MALTPRTSRVGLATIDPAALAQRERPRSPEAEDSVADLATRLAQEGWGLAGVEVRRISAELRERKHYAGRAAIALILGGTFGAVATLVLAAAAVLYLGETWGNYAAGALATGVVLLLLAIVAGATVMASARRFSHRKPAGDRAAARQERSPVHGP
jgi:uncharacterized membrane protein YqjE